MRQYFIHDGQSEKGPLDIEQLKLETLKKETPIWYDGLESWTTVAEVEELKNLVRATPPPLKKAETINSTPPKIETNHTYSKPENKVETVKQKSNVLLYSILGFIALGGIISWLVFENIKAGDKAKTQETEKIKQDSVINDVKTEIAKKKEEDIQKENQKLIEEQEKQAEKDRVNGVITEKYMGYRNNWRNFIAATSNGFSYSEMGGISDLAVIVYNQTDKNIDEIQVRVDYIKTNGGVFKTELVSVTNVAPNSEKSVSAPSSERGTSVKMDIESISAKSFHFCYPSGMEGNQNLDPYFCK